MDAVFSSCSPLVPTGESPIGPSYGRAKFTGALPSDFVEQGVLAVFACLCETRPILGADQRYFCLDSSPPSRNVPPNLFTGKTFFYCVISRSVNLTIPRFSFRTESRFGRLHLLLAGEFFFFLFALLKYLAPPLFTPSTSSLPARSLDFRSEQSPFSLVIQTKINGFASFSTGVDGHWFRPVLQHSRTSADANVFRPYCTSPPPVFLPTLLLSAHNSAGRLIPPPNGCGFSAPRPLLTVERPCRSSPSAGAN